MIFPDISLMPIEDKVGQMLMAHFHGSEANEDAKFLIQEIRVGSVIYYTWANGLESRSEVRLLSHGLQQMAKVPLLIAADQEGGIVQRLQKGFTHFPGNGALGSIGVNKLAKEAASAMGKEMLFAGVTMNLAPVVDINNEPRNPIIGIRSFGETAEAVTALGKAALRGFHEAGVLTTIKHWPGHGRVRVDSHYAMPVLDEPLSVLRSVEFAPFDALFPHTDAVMTAHILAKAIDPETCVTLSKRAISRLRKECGDDVVIVSDSLVMQGVLEIAGSVDEAAIRAIQAGHDLLCLGGKQLVGESKVELTAADVARIHGSVVRAVREGRISEERVEESVRRLFNLKRKMALELPSEVNWRAHEELAEEIATRALAVEGSLRGVAEKEPLLVAPEFVKSSSSLAERKAFILSSEAEIEALLEASASKELVVFFTYNAWKNPLQQKAIARLLASGKRVGLVALRDPVDVTLFPESVWSIKTFSPVEASIVAALTRLGL